MSQQRLTLHVNAVGAVMGGAARHLDPFLRAMVGARPSWRFRVYVGSGLPLETLPASVEITRVRALGRVGRVWWESVPLALAVRRDGASALLNLTNSAPVIATVPSVMYQRNALYFDPSWLEDQSPRFRLDAAVRRMLAGLQMRSQAAVVTPSEAMAGFLQAWRTTPRERPIVAIPHGVSTDEFVFREREWPPPSTRPVRLLSVGHGAPHKDQLLLIELVRHLADDGVDAVLELTVDRADSPSYVDSLGSAVRRLGLQRRVTFLGRVDDVNHLYHQGDVVVFPSRVESFGLPIVEALACGTPIVASRIPASVELAGPSAWYFEPGSVTRAAECVMECLATSAGDMQRRLIEGEAVAHRHSWEANAEAVASLVERCVAEAAE